MAALAPYIPNRDADLSNWAANFSALISGSPATYGLVAGDATAIAAAVAAFQAAYALVTSPTTKTAETVATKNTEKVTMLAVVRPYAQSISLNAGVTSGNKIAVGVNPRTLTPSPVTPPTTSPVLVVQSAASLAIVLRYRDSAASVSVKSKPYGVSALQLSAEVSATPITDPTAIAFKQVATKSPLVVQFQPGDAGKQCYFAARWQTRTGGLSPWSAVISFTVPQGS